MKNLIAARPHARSFLFLIVILALLSGCSGQAPATSPAPAETSLPEPVETALSLPPTLLPTVTAASLPTSTPDERVSEPGKYEGYSEALYDDFVSSSEYITVRDGTKLAAFILRPAQNGQPVSTPLPVIWMHDRYHREEILNWFWLQTCLEHGYVVVSVDVRGSGASFGAWLGPLSPEETRDAYDVTEWLAQQPWSDGNIGMYGRSYMGLTQLMAASTAPPHLKAIFPEMHEFDHYSFFSPGGALRSDFIRQWGVKINTLDASGLPVDEDVDQSMLQAALQERAASLDVYDLYEPLPYRDSQSDVTGTQLYFVNSPASYLEEINSSGVAVYNWVGWLDMFPKDALLWYTNLTTPKKIVIGPWSHPEVNTLDLGIEQLRWFDYWLKGIDNGIMSEAPIYYYTFSEGDKAGWHSAWQWPLPEEKRTNYYFDGAASGSVKSVNDGSLSLEMPAATGGVDEYVVDYTTTSGTSTRWSAGYDVTPPVYPTMMFNDVKGLTYTSPPLTAELEITGHPLVHLWVTSSASDADFFVYLEDVSPGNFSKYITEGNLRLSHRAVSEAPFETLGLPYHRSYAEDMAALPVEPVEMVFDLIPTSYVFSPGHRIRVTITGADKDAVLTPQQEPAPTIQLYRDAEHPSYIELPVIPGP